MRAPVSVTTTGTLLTATTTKDQSAPPKPRSGLRRFLTSDNPAAWLMLAPAIALLAWWYATPIVESLVLSFQHVSEFDFDQRNFVGLQNFQQLISDPAFHKSLGITATFVVGVVPAQTIVALVIAALLHSISRAKGALRTAYFVPYMTSTIAVTTIFMQLFVKGGVAATALSVVGIPNQTWYASTHLALWFLVVVYVYMFVGLYIVIFAGGMETIPKDLYDAASIDGAGPIRQFWAVTLPGVRPFLAFVLITGVIQAIQVFDQAYVIAGGTVLGSPAGATSTIVIFIYQQAFRLLNIGYASAATVFLLAGVIVLGGIGRRFAPKGD
jgi:multiple sugar transport system permease protein